MNGRRRIRNIPLLIIGPVLRVGISCTALVKTSTKDEPDDDYHNCGPCLSFLSFYPLFFEGEEKETQVKVKDQGSVLFKFWSFVFLLVFIR